MITKKVDRDDAGKLHAEFYGLSTDDKAACDDPRNANVFYEMDTQAVYMYDQDGGTWLPQ